MSDKPSEFAGAKQITVKPSDPISKLIRVIRDTGKMKGSVLFDFGQGNHVVVAAFLADGAGYMNAVEAYEQGRDMWASVVANAVVEDIKKNGMPDPDNPQPFNIVGAPVEEVSDGGQ